MAPRSYLKHKIQRIQLISKYIQTFKVTDFPWGLIDTVEDQAIPNGAASRSNNWLTEGDHIELRRGLDLMGTENLGTGGILGQHTTYKANGTELAYRKNGRKLEYFNETTSDWAEVGTNIFPAAATTDEASFANYASLAGSQMFVCSPNAGPFKIMTASPGSYTDLTDAAKNFQGRIKIKQNRMFLWGRTKDKTGVYGSYIDTATYTTVTGEATASLSGTLAFKAAGTVRTCFAVAITITASGEVYTDDYNGVLTGSLGGTGTINYTTGAYTVSNAGVGTAAYQWENSNNNGITDFTKSAPRVAAQGFVFRQDDGGGDLQGVESYADTEFCLHNLKTWALTLTSTDTSATNLIYRDKVGIPNHRAAVATGEGIYYIDDSDQADPQFRILTLSQTSGLVVPQSVSKRKAKNGATWGVNLSDYRFDTAVSYEWGKYILFACRHKDATANNTLITFNKVTQALDKSDISANCFSTYNGTLLVGDSISNNTYVAFSGFDDDDSLIPNYWEGNLSTLDVEELKKCKKLVVQGLIASEQTLNVYAAVDNGGYTLIDTITGDGTYVDRGQAINVGSLTVGSHELGGGGDGISAYNYEHALRLTLDKFYQIKLKFEAVGIGYVSINKYRFFDIRLKGAKVLAKYRN
jgi:hypothetical protein